MLGKLLSSVALTLAIVGCACRNNAASSAEGGPPRAPAKRWRQDPPGEDPPQDIQEQVDRHTANREGEPADDPREPAKDGPREPAADVPREPAEDKQREPRANGPPKPAESDAVEQMQSPGGESEATSSDQEPGVITLSSDDCDVWPSYDWPLEITVEVLEVPERITKPAPPIDDD